jgi:hypothetical protein
MAATCAALSLLTTSEDLSSLEYMESAEIDSADHAEADAAHSRTNQASLADWQRMAGLSIDSHKVSNVAR